MNDEFRIQLRIAGKTYPYYCKRTPEDEGNARKAADQINEQMVLYRKTFAVELDSKDLLAMVAFQLSLEDVKKIEDQNLLPVFDKLHKLNQEMEKCLSVQNG